MLIEITGRNVRPWADAHMQREGGRAVEKECAAVRSVDLYVFYFCYYSRLFFSITTTIFFVQRGV